MFKKLLAAVGVGGAEVETELHTPGVQPGGSVQGVVRLRGGEVAQQLDGVSVEFVTRVEHEVDDDEVTSKRAFGRQKRGRAFSSGVTTSPPSVRSMVDSIFVRPAKTAVS